MLGDAASSLSDVYRRRRVPPRQPLPILFVLTAVTACCAARAQITTDGSGNIKLKSTTANKEFAPEEISAQILRKLCGDAGNFLGADVKKVRAGASTPSPASTLRLR